VHAHRDHAGEQVEGRFDVDHAGLDAPWPEPLYVDAPPDCDSAVLMPTQRPVLLRALVKENCADRKTLGTKYGNRYGADWAGGAEAEAKFGDAGESRTPA
jgi:hypothetical protein